MIDVKGVLFGHPQELVSTCLILAFSRQYFSAWL